MVQTRAATKKVVSGQVQNDNAAQPQSAAIKLSPVKKQRREGADAPTQASKRRRRGKPGVLCQLNLDVLFLIAAYVHPIDLINLARTCRSLRQLLMHKSSEFVWKIARSQVERFPDCPTDLTELQYAHLTFYARCGGCGKHVKTILWVIRRRYCPKCKLTRLVPLDSCDKIILDNDVLATENLTIGDRTTMWVDKEQMESFMHEYDCASDKKHFLEMKQEAYSAVNSHAKDCEYWQKCVASTRKYELHVLRETSIFERIRLHGFGPEIDNFGYGVIRDCHKSFFRASNPLTDKEWVRMWPEWLETLSNFRFLRLDRTVWQQRRELLASAYDNYIASLPPDTFVIALLPHADDLACFPPFRDIIRAPEETQIDGSSFESAFEQLPDLVDDWRKQLDAELAELVKIPSYLSLKGTSSSPAVTSGSTTGMDAATDKLRLASAVFITYAICTYPDVLNSMRHREHVTISKDESERPLSFQERFHIRLLEDAPFIVHACGLDPNEATVEDMDRRNARIACLACKDGYIGSWRDAHARVFHQNKKARDCKLARWRAIDDEYIDAIRAAELSVRSGLSPAWTRCLLCCPRVGDAMIHLKTVNHLMHVHKIGNDDIKAGVHYRSVGIHEVCSVKMVKKGGQLTFKNPLHCV